MRLAFGVTAWIQVSPDGVQQAGHVRALPEGAQLGSAAAWRVPMPPAERRRLNPLSVLALQAAERLVNSGAGLAVAPAAFARFPLVYANAQGDGDVLLKLLASLAAHEAVSPTQFHNSVHNAPSGYWSIGNKSQAPSISLAAGEQTLAAALIEAGVQAQTGQTPVLLVVCDRPHSGPLHAVTLGVKETTTAALVVPAGHAAAAWHCTLDANTKTNTPENVVATAATIIASFVSNAEQALLDMPQFNAALRVQRQSV